jgi:hypothetical protein
MVLFCVLLSNSSGVRPPHFRLAGTSHQPSQFALLIFAVLQAPDVLRAKFWLSTLKVLLAARADASPADLEGPLFVSFPGLPRGTLHGAIKFNSLLVYASADAARRKPSEPLSLFPLFRARVEPEGQDGVSLHIFQCLSYFASSGQPKLLQLKPQPAGFDEQRRWVDGLRAQTPNALFRVPLLMAVERSDPLMLVPFPVRACLYFLEHHLTELCLFDLSVDEQQRLQELQFRLEHAPVAEPFVAFRCGQGCAKCPAADSAEVVSVAMAAAMLASFFKRQLELQFLFLSKSENRYD